MAAAAASASLLWLVGLHLQPLGPRVPRDRDGDGGGMWRWVRQQLVGASVPPLLGRSAPRGLRGPGGGLGRTEADTGPGVGAALARVSPPSLGRPPPALVGSLPPPLRPWVAAVRGGDPEPGRRPVCGNRTRERKETRS